VTNGAVPQSPWRRFEVSSGVALAIVAAAGPGSAYRSVAAPASGSAPTAADLRRRLISKEIPALPASTSEWPIWPEDPRLERSTTPARFTA
jgi:hypothetical protein